MLNIEGSEKETYKLLDSLIANKIFAISRKLSIDTKNIRIKIKAIDDKEIEVSILDTVNFIKKSSLSDIFSNDFILLPMIPYIKQTIIKEIQSFSKENNLDINNVDMRIGIKYVKEENDYSLIISFFYDNKFVKVI